MNSPAPDLARLNAYVDGELDAAEAAAVALQVAADSRIAEQVASLHAVKSALGAAFLEDPVIVQVPAARRAPASLRVAAWAAAAAAVVLGIAAFGAWQLERSGVTTRVAPVASGPTAAPSAWTAALAPGVEIVVPDISPAGLVPAYVEMARAANGVPLTHVAYVGHRGCHLSLYSADKAAKGGASDFFPDRGLQVASWDGADARFFAVARKMDPVRFAVITAALEDATIGASPLGDQLKVALAGAHQPCRA